MFDDPRRLRPLPPSSIEDPHLSHSKYSQAEARRVWGWGEGEKGDKNKKKDAGFLPHTCTGVRRLRTGSGTARLHRTPAPGPLLGTGSLVSEVHCPDTSPDLSCQTKQTYNRIVSRNKGNLSSTLHRSEVPAPSQTSHFTLGHQRLPIT